MRFVGVVLFASLLTACANPYTRFYQGNADARTHPAYIASSAAPVVYASTDFDKDIISLERKSYVVIGSSSFNAGANSVHESQLVEQAKKVGAHVVLTSSKFTHTVSGAIPLTVPDNSTSYTTANVTAYGPSGTSNAYGNATTTTYGTQTVMMPYSVQRSDFGAVYLAKSKTRLGAFVIDLDDATRQRIQSNKGVVVRNIVDGSPAFDADILPGDVLISLNGETVSSVQGYVALIDRFQGQAVEVQIYRGNKAIQKTVRIRTYGEV